MAAAESFACADAVVLRAALAVRRLPPGARLGELTGVFRTDPLLAAALEVASPDLAERVRLPAGDGSRLVRALTGYLLRSRHRATPFGLFAGTAVIRTGPRAEGTIGAAHRVLLRPAPRWQSGLAAALQSEPDRVPGLGLTASSELHRCGPLHALVAFPPDAPGLPDIRTTVRRTALTDAIVALAAGPGGIGSGPLLDILHTAAPATDRAELAALLARLLETGLLAGDLLPPPGSPDPLLHLARRLAGDPLGPRLHRIRGALRETSASAVTADRIRRLRGMLTAVSECGAGLVTDVLLDTDLRLPHRVVAEVERAAQVAWACAPRPARQPLARLHLAMLDRYGADRPVPLPELLDPVRNLRLRAAAQRGPRDAAGPPRPTARDRLLRGLALDALRDGRTELHLDRALRHRLAATVGPAAELPASFDVYAEVVTPDAAALDRGDFLVALGNHSSPGPACSTVGRLAGLSDSVGPPAAVDRHPLPVEVVFQPPDSRAATLVGAPGMVYHRINLTPHRDDPDRDLDLADLWLTATLDGFRLHSERLARTVRPVSHSALNPDHAGGAAALLLALGRHGTAVWTAWDWGAAGTLDRLPRVRTGKAVLAPARWRLPPELLHLAETGDDREWSAGLARWRDAVALPGTVFAGAWDRRLPLELADPVHASLLRRACTAHGVVTVTEPPGGAAAWHAVGWPTDAEGQPHTAEFVFPLYVRTAAGEAAPPAVPVRDTTSVHHPGGPWLCAALSVPTALQDTVLGRLEGLKPAPAADRWFYVRTEGPGGEPQLVVRFHGDPYRLHTELLPAMHSWTAEHRNLIADFALTSYHPELARYGGSACIEAAERVFHHDTRLALRTLGDSAAAPLAVLHILTIMLGSPAAVARLRGPRLTPAERGQFLALRPALRTAAHEQPLAAAGRGVRSVWQDWRTALSGYRSELLGAGTDPEPVAWSLVHMHGNRRSADRRVERVAVALALDLARTRSTAQRGRGGAL